MNIPIYQVDAFSEAIFSGNPAAVCPLDNWPDDTVLQNIAMENNLSETAFLVRKENHYEIRWFTPVAEVELCGHATLASAHTSLTPFWAHRLNQLSFEAAQLSKRGGFLHCQLSGDRVLISGKANTYLIGEIFIDPSTSSGTGSIYQTL